MFYFIWNVFFFFFGLTFGLLDWNKRQIELCILVRNSEFISSMCTTDVHKTSHEDVWGTAQKITFFVVYKDINLVNISHVCADVYSTLEPNGRAGDGKGPAVERDALQVNPPGCVKNKHCLGLYCMTCSRIKLLLATRIVLLTDKHWLCSWCRRQVRGNTSSELAGLQWASWTTNLHRWTLGCRLQSLSSQIT